MMQCKNCGNKGRGHDLKMGRDSSGRKVLLHSKLRVVNDSLVCNYYSKFRVRCGCSSPVVRTVDDNIIKNEELVFYG